MKPNLIDLQNFTNTYFGNKPPIVKWGYLKGKVKGEAVLGEMTICLDSAHIYFNSSKKLILKESFSHNRGHLLKLSKGEHYFLALLHEIAKFKIKSELQTELKERIKVKEELLRKVEKDLYCEKLNRKKLGKKPMNRTEEEEFLKNTKERYLVNKVSLNRREGETTEEWEARLEDFRTWFRGGFGFMEDRIKKLSSVENWAIKEFKKKRKEIRKILKKNKINK